jgi:hypothetical protein
MTLTLQCILIEFYRLITRLVTVVGEPACVVNPLIMSPLPKNNKAQNVNAPYAPVSYHQNRGCYVQRSEYGCYPRGRLRRLV